MYQNENKTCWKYLFHSSLSSPWASKLPNGAVCTLSFPTGPFEGTMAFLPRSPAPRPPRGKDDEARRPGGQELPPAQGEWQDGESARAPVLLGVVKACGRQPGKFRRTQPGTDYSAAPQKDTAGRGLTTIVSFAAFDGGSQGDMGQRCCLQGMEVRSHPASETYCSGICKPPFSFSLRWVVVGNGTWGEGREPLMNGWRRGKDKRRHCGQMELSWA